MVLSRTNTPNLCPPRPLLVHSKSFTFSAQTYEVVRVCNSGSHQTRTDSNSYWWHTDDACVSCDHSTNSVCECVLLTRAEVTNIMIIRRIMVEFIHSSAKKPEIDVAHNWLVCRDFRAFQCCLLVDLDVSLIYYKSICNSQHLEIIQRVHRELKLDCTVGGVGVGGGAGGWRDSKLVARYLFVFLLLLLYMYFMELFYCALVCSLRMEKSRRFTK